MRKLAVVCSLLVITMGFAVTTSAQENAKAQESSKVQEPAQPVHYYHLVFVIEELNSDGKPVNSRTFSTSVSTQPQSWTSIRTGSRVPIATGSKSDATPQTVTSTDFQYVNIGVNVDVHNAREVEHQLALDLITEFNSAATPDRPDAHQPVMRQNKWQAALLIPIGKSTVAFTSDSLESKGSTRVLITATPIQ
jgi:hypothetical protein